ncbi:hypothetical protein GUITHDRAFT_87533 [Guillardia theta CCMP2712]|uniref:pyridoxal kinase n=1 Tax=Guillardia theta (strain CCMP2712) TaxID=905079 RepID=L1J6G9_GUITC|nr:hypothetical protein GUITHDRAFT_87533 [Guillardia theta CCMP2712]EKX44116.1 hypothetical protein GUITHDRAFT_87533 [Guillardia theta CCMP2712]|mmetsp:Transcript_989/g.3122  ORF Transcript_989/g.3122 Transcript_989/m.3122 type:complete len:297 (-) Transcript_989:1273-2163(-)|eukprot:XP_005831096.1 hypothetical protein GUITHDRAFT_87533 [Guillardia theta CCMP2712]
MIPSFRVQSPRVLSIQSHTVHGYVGNKSAVFPMQTLGIEVDFVNSVQFSNHTGYPTWTGKALDGDDLSELIRGLRSNGLLKHTHLLTGYMRSASLIRCVMETLDELRKENGQVIYVCDPVMGDNGQLYVPQEIVSVYRDEVVPKATILTPNQFEAEVLTGVKISDISSAVKAIDILHERGVQCVVITSMHLEGSDSIFLLASLSSSSQPPQRLKITIPKLEATFTGTGDMLAALILSWFQLTDDLKTVIENATATLQAVLANTVKLQSKELQLIYSRKEISDPQVPDWLRAESLSS